MALRDDPPGEPVHLLEPPVEVELTVDGATHEGFAERWRGRWVYCTWSTGPGMRHLGWVLGEDVRRV